MTGDNAVKTYECPSFDFSRTFGARAEFTEYMSTEHPDEYQHDDWPDTPAGREVRRDRNEESSDEGDSEVYIQSRGHDRPMHTTRYADYVIGIALAR